MSAQSIINQISSVDREIGNYQQQIHSLDNSIASKQKDAHSIMDKIHREKDVKRVLGYSKDLTRKNEEITRLEKDKACKAKYLADKEKKKRELQQELTKEEAKDREKAKKEHQEILNIQQQIAREMDFQRFRSASTIQNLRTPTVQKQYDVFVSHASEDKEDFVRPFVAALQNVGLSVWYDELEMRIGDSLRRSIDAGLKNSTYGIIVLSNNFFKKEWPQKELDGMFAKEVNGSQVILPLWHKISKDEVMAFSPMIADMVALNTSSFTIEEMAQKIADKVLSK